jgi:hypothetical protein
MPGEALPVTAQPYRPRQPRRSPLWRCLNAYFNTFRAIYPEAYEREYGCLRAVIPEVVGKFMDCGDFAKGFARVRCDRCNHEYLLAFSCKGRWFCPSCHQNSSRKSGKPTRCCARTTRNTTRKAIKAISYQFFPIRSGKALR